jgi:hypothetical protein
MGELQQYPQSIACLAFSQNLSNKGKRKQWKRPKNKKNEQRRRLAYTLVFQTMSFPLNYFFLFRPIDMPPK